LKYTQTKPKNVDGDSKQQTGNIANREAYESEASCKNGIASVKKNAPLAEIVMVDE